MSLLSYCLGVFFNSLCFNFPLLHTSISAFFLVGSSSMEIYLCCLFFVCVSSSVLKFSPLVGCKGFDGISCCLRLHLHSNKFDFHSIERAPRSRMHHLDTITLLVILLRDRFRLSFRCMFSMSEWCEEYGQIYTYPQHVYVTRVPEFASRNCNSFTLFLQMKQNELWQLVTGALSFLLSHYML